MSAKKKLTPNAFAAIQADTVSMHARDLLPRLLAHVQPATSLDRAAVDILRSWNDDARGDQAAPAIFEAWFLHLAPSIVGDELGPLTAGYETRFSSVTRFVSASLDRNPDWCDNVATPVRENCDQAVTTALHAGVEELSEKMGREVARWRWDSVHKAIFPHQGLDAVAALRPLLSRSVPNGGDWSTVNVGPVAADARYEQHSVPGYREIVDLSHANDSRFIEAVGPSGHFLSKYYDAYLSDWRAVRYRKMRTDRLDIETGAIGRLRLTPKALGTGR